MRVLLTGGAGFIGSHLSDLLIDAGHDVVALDNLSTGSVENLRQLEGSDHFELVEGSVLDAGLVASLSADADAIVHLAAAVGVRLIVEHPLDSMNDNILGTINVLEGARQGSARVLIASTSEVFGKNDELLTESSDRIIGPTSVDRWSYSVAKAVDEIYALAYFKELGVPTVIARLFNTVGPRQTGVYGMVVPRLVSQALLGEELTVYGDGTQTRCFCHVSDVIAALADLLVADGALGESYNVGASEEISILALAQRILELTGSSSTIRLVPLAEAYGENFEDVPRRRPDTAKLRGLLGWAPTRGIDQIIEDVSDAIRSSGPSAALGRS
jgi:UDP-glucose 4-epimerase